MNKFSDIVSNMEVIAFEITLDKTVTSVILFTPQRMVVVIIYPILEFHIPKVDQRRI